MWRASAGVPRCHTEPQRRDGRGHRARGPPGVQRAVPPRGRARPARRRLPLRSLRRPDGRAPPGSFRVIVFSTLERVLAYAVADEPALLAARDEWNVRAGVVHDDEPLYEERAAAFLDWFALDRRSTPARSTARARPPTPPPPPAASRPSSGCSPRRPTTRPTRSIAAALSALARLAPQPVPRARPVARGPGARPDAGGPVGGAAFRARDRG